MTLMDKSSRLLLAPPARGRKALLYAILLVTIPTGLRLLVDHIVGGRLPFFSYMPFIILAGALLTWRSAALVALVSWIVADLLFMEPRFDFSLDTVEAIGFLVFATSSALIIALVEAVRTIVENSLRPSRPEGFAAPVVFSLERGEAWASWYGSHSWVRLGPEDDVAEMMRDFLAQRELGKRLDPAGSPNP
jgi:hypothetical protein